MTLCDDPVDKTLHLSADCLPEWSTTNTEDVDNIGTFDSSGAFMSVKVCSLLCRSRCVVFYVGQGV